MTKEEMNNINLSFKNVEEELTKLKHLIQSQKELDALSYQLEYIYLQLKQAHEEHLPDLNI